MFRHRGKSRTLIHNLKLASLLSLVAGIVNVSGLFAVQRLTTNVTGHLPAVLPRVIAIAIITTIAYPLAAADTGLIVQTTSL